MRTVAIRTFAGGYHRGRPPRNAYSPAPSRGGVASARSLLSLLGLGFALAGVGVAWAVDRLIGMLMLVVGAFLLILPFTRPDRDE